MEGIILEYFEHGDAGEVIAALDEMNMGQKKHKVFKTPI